MPTGYRHGSIGEYTGGDPKHASIAWKALDYEYRELGNAHLLQDVSKFLGMPTASWNNIIKEFRKRYGDATGMWLTRTKKDADELYGEYGNLEKHQYREEDVVSDLGSDGIFVLQGTTLSDLDTGYADENGEWVYYSAKTKTKPRNRKPTSPTLSSLR